jgi:endonuclease/exonuclease/phosphatase family metal-dependent hydrolase
LPVLRGLSAQHRTLMGVAGFRGLASSVGLASILAGAACATAKNYLDPTGPRYTGDHSPSPTDARAAPIRVVTFNIEYGRRTEEATAALERYAPLRSPDVLCLQEMDSEGVDRMARALGFNYVYYPGNRDGKTSRDFGNAVLTRWPVERSWKVLLPHDSRILHRARAAVAVQVRTANGPLTVYSVHLGSPIGISGGQRKQQAQAILDDLRTRSGPVVIAGDFNSKSVGEAFVAAGFDWPTRDIGGTRGGHSFDHVFARGFISGEPADAGVVREAKEASDHRPVWALLQPPAEAPAEPR